MSGTLLLIFGGVLFFGGLIAVLILVNVRWVGWMLAVMAAGIVVVIVGAVVMSNQESNACHARGGTMVADGAPVYVKSGNVLVPVQGEKCVVQR